MSHAATYYEQWGPVARRVRRAGHYARFVAKTSLGLRPSLLVELRWRLGDEIMALPIFEALRAKWPAARIEALSNYPELFVDNPFVDAVNPPAPSPDAYYLLRGAPREVARAVHYAREAEVSLPSGRPRLHYRDWTSPLLAEMPRGDGPLIAIAPGASWASKRWDTESWRALARVLEARGCRVFEVCGPGEGVGIATSFAGRTNVREAAILLHAATLLIGSDSGLMHLARAADTPVIALFGPTDPVLLVGGDDGVQCMSNGRACSGCWNSGRMREPGACPIDEPNCLGTIGVDDVAQRVWATLGLG